jgi:hypothetical protein
MTSYVPVIKNGASGAILYVSLAPRTASGQWQSNPTLAAGDVKVSLDGGALANLATLPAVTPAASKLVKITLSQAETNADNIAIIFSDAAGAEWCDLTVNLQTVAKQFDDLATQAALDAVDTVADAIKAKTDNLPADPADASDIAGRFTTLDTNLATVAGYLDTEIGAIKAKTDNLPADPADASDIAGRFTTLETNLATVAGYLDTEIGAIKAKTDNLPSDPADASDIAGRFTTLDTNLATVAGYLDTEIGAIKAKTDNLPAAPAATGDIPSAATIAAAVWASVLDGTHTAAQLARGWTAALLGKASGLVANAPSAPTYRNIADDKDVISAVTDESGNRSTVTLDLDP